MAKRLYGLNPIAIGLSDNPQFQPQLNNHFEAQLFLPSSIVQNDEDEILKIRQYLTLGIETFNEPDIGVDVLQIPHANTKVQIAGQVNSAQTGTFTTTDYIGIDMKKRLQDWMSLVYNPSTSQMGWATNYKTKSYLISYSPDGALISGWQLIGFFPTNVKAEDHDKNNAAISRITVSYSYDLAVPLRNSNNRSQYEQAVKESAQTMVPPAPGKSYPTSNMGGPLTNLDISD